MQKRGLILLILIASISFVSAQMGIGEFLDAFGGENLLLMGSFVISFVLIFFILGRLPIFKTKSKEYPYKEKRNKAVPGVIAFIISLFIVYGINKFDFNIANFFSNFGIGEGMLEVIAMVAILAALFFLFWKFKSLVILFLGLLLIGISFTDFVYEKEGLLFAGIVLIVVWILIKIFFRKKKEKSPNHDYISDEDRKKQVKQVEAPYKKMKDQQPSQRQPPKTPEKKAPPKMTGAGRFDIFFGGKKYTITDRGGQISSTDLTQRNETRVSIGNGGSGGIILWKAAASKGLALSKNTGKLRKGQQDEVIIQIQDRAALINQSKKGGKPHITILGKRGATFKGVKDFIMKSVGKTVIYFKVEPPAS